MIAGFRHRGLKRLYADDDRSKVSAAYVERLRTVLAALDAADTIEDMDLPTFRLHALKGDMKGFWAVTVQAYWRVTFRFHDGHATEVDWVDYH